MPRPRRDSEILPAKERLENAFWELLSEREYRKITVTDIVRTADVNRNSFYYHFTGLPELADSAILHAVENTPLPSAPNANFNPDNEWRKHVTALLREPEQRQRLDRLALLAGPHSSPELVESLQDFGRLTLISVLGLDADHLDLKTDLMLDFTVGGMLAVLRRWPKLHEQLPMDAVFNEDVAVLATAYSCPCPKPTCWVIGSASSAAVSWRGRACRAKPNRKPNSERCAHVVTFRW